MRRGKKRKENQNIRALQLRFETDLSLTEIAKIVGVSYNTILNWSKEWENEHDIQAIKGAKFVTAHSLVNQYYRQLYFLNKKIQEREEEERFPTTQEADQISKITKAIDALDKRVDLGLAVTFFEEFTALMQKLNQVDLLREVEPFFVEYIAIKESGKRIT